METDPIDVPGGYVDSDTMALLERDVGYFVREHYGDADVAGITVTVHLRRITDDERRVYRDT